MAAAIQVVAVKGVKGDAIGQDPLDHDQHQLDFGLEFPVSGDGQLFTSPLIGCREPFLWQIEFAINPGTVPIFGQSQKHTHLAHLYFAQAAIMLPTAPGAPFTSFLVGTFIGNEDTPLLVVGQTTDILLQDSDQILPVPR